MLLEMRKVQLVGLREKKSQALASLLKLGVWHPEEPTLDGPISNSESSAEREDVAYQLARCDAALQLLPPVDRQDRSDDLLSAPEVKATLDALMPTLQDLATRLDEATAAVSSHDGRASALERLWPATSGLSLREDEAAVVLTCDRRRLDKLKLVLLALDQAHGPVRSFTAAIDEGTCATVVAFPSRNDGRLLAGLQLDFVSLTHLSRNVVGASLGDVRRHLAVEKRAHDEALRETQAELAQLSAEKRARVAACRESCQRRLEELDADRFVGGTRHTFVLEGWLPKRDVKKVETTLRGELGDNLVLHQCPLTEESKRDAPVAFDNPSYLKPYESLIRMMGVPAAGSRDPSFLMAVFFPLFFGIIVGDIGYGALFLVLALWARQRFKADETIRGAANVLLVGSVWSLVWGLLYGEIFGTLQYNLGLEDLYIFVPRTGERIGELMVFAVVLGAAHVSLGLLLGLWDAFREKHLKEAMAKGGLLVTLFALFLVAAILADLLPSTLYTPALVAAVIGTVVLMCGAGFLGAVELFETMGNVLSYLRLTAVGLAGVYIALVANKMVGVLGNVVLGVIVALLLHALNFAILLMSPAIQSLRLHYVEFFRQFYRSGGQEYQPLRYGT